MNLKYRNFSSCSYYCISRFFAWLHFIWIIRIRLKGKRYPNQSKSKKSKYPAGLDSKIRILYTADILYMSEMSIGQRWADIDILTPDPYPKKFLHVNIQSFSENFRNLVSNIHPYPIAALAKYQWCSRNRNLRDRAETSRPRLCHKSRDRDLKARDVDSRPHISLMVIKANSLKNAAKIFEMLSNTKMKAFAVAVAARSDQVSSPLFNRFKLRIRRSILWYVQFSMSKDCESFFERSLKV